MARKPDTLAAFEVAPTFLRFVEMLHDERRILSAGTIALEPGRWYDREHLEARARSLLADTAKGRIVRLIASVPAGHAHFRLVDAPKGDGARDYLAWDASVYLAHPIEQYALDFAPIPPTHKDDEGGLGEGVRHAAAAMRRAHAEAVRDALQSAVGVPLAALDVDAAAIVNAFEAVHPELLPGRSLLIQAEWHAAVALRMRDGSLEGITLEREAVESLRKGVEDQERAEGLLRRVRGLGDGLRKTGDEWQAPDRVLLCGELATDTDFQELLRTQITAPLRLLNPFTGIPGPDPADCPGAWPAAPFAAAVGLLLRLVEEP